jgi:Mg2+ and Co2+ transporter CorA
MLPAVCRAPHSPLLVALDLIRALPVVTDNPHTTLSAGQLKSEYESLLDATASKQKLVSQEIAKKNESGVSAEQIAEFREIYNHFDKVCKSVVVMCQVSH